MASPSPAVARSPDRRASCAWLLIPAACAALVLLPRLLDPHFGLLDDALNTTIAQRILGGDFSMAYDTHRGRYRPLYWLLFAGLYGLFGSRPGWFFAFNALLLAATAAGLAYLAHRAGARRWLAAAAGVLIAVAPATLENVYTFSKGEPFQVLALLASLAPLAGWQRARGWGARAVRILGIGLGVYLAAIMKETTLAIAPIALGWAAWSLLVRSRRAPSFIYLAGAALGLLAYEVSRLAVLGSLVGVNTQNYDLSPARLLDSIIRWAGWLARDYLWLAPVLLFALAVLLAGPAARRAALLRGSLAPYALIWMTGWVVIFLPWKTMSGYYSMPFAAGAVLLLALGLEFAARSRARAWVWAAAGLLVALTLPAAYTTAAIQLAVDRANAQMLTALRQIPEPGSTILINIQDPNEYSEEIALYTRDLGGRTDLTLQPLDPNAPPPAARPFYVLSPAMENMPLLTVRLGVIEQTQRAWNQDLPAVLGPAPESAFANRHSVPMLAVDFPRLFCPLLRGRGFCAAPQPLIDTRTFHYGWTLYRVR